MKKLIKPIVKLSLTPMKSHHRGSSSLVRRGCAHNTNLFRNTNCDRYSLPITSTIDNDEINDDDNDEIRTRSQKRRKQSRQNIKQLLKSILQQHHQRQILRSSVNAFLHQRDTIQRSIRLVLLITCCIFLYNTAFVPPLFGSHSKRMRLLLQRPTAAAFLSAAEPPILLLLTHEIAATRGQPSLLLFPPKLDKETSWSPDYGDIAIWFLAQDGVPRSIFRDSHVDNVGTTATDSIIQQRNRQNRDDDIEDYYAFDDDVMRSQYISYPHYPLAPQRHCRRTHWHRFVFPTCNNMHELSMDNPSNRATFLSFGSYRHVFTADHNFINTTDTVVVKHIRYHLPYNYENFEYVRLDALVSERLTASPHVADIYTHCGISLMLQFFPQGDIEELVVPSVSKKTEATIHSEAKNNNTELMDGVMPETVNHLTSSEKLHLALQMAEGIAALHGYRDGVIVHNDIQLTQFLRVGRAGSSNNNMVLKLNDFNRAEIMLWDEQHYEYCRYRQGEGQGDYRSPEEYLDKPLNEKIDVWSFGNNLFALLTGRYPFFALNNATATKIQVKNGAQQFIDPRYRNQSYADGTLVDLIQRCWVNDPDKRADMFEIVEILREAVKEHDHR